MDSELEKQIKMSYDEQCFYLQKKYGLPTRDYFATEACRSKSKGITRTSEGLFLHHNAENLGNGGNLGDPHLARIHPFEYQKRENLTYCNYLEHLLLHLKINARCCSEFEWPFELRYFFTSQGFFWICNDVNSLYINNGSNTKWRNDCYLVISNHFDDYVDILKGTLHFLDDNYTGDRQLSIKEGTKLCFDIIDVSKQNSSSGKDIKKNYTRYDQTVVQINKEDNTAVLRLTSGKETVVALSKLENQFDFEAQKHMYISFMSSLSDGTQWIKLERLLLEPCTQQQKLISTWIKDGIG